jgi:hypothetical protein
MKLHPHSALREETASAVRVASSSRSGRWRRRPRPPRSAFAARASGLVAIAPTAKLGLLDRPSTPATIADRMRDRRLIAIARCVGAVHRAGDP